MDVKTIVIVVALVVLLYLQGCFPSVSAQNSRQAQEQAPQVEIDPAECYAQVNDAVRDDWAQMSKLQRFTIGMKAINLCEGDN